MHLFLSAPPPRDMVRNVPLLESPTPVIIALNALPTEWKFASAYALPAEVVVGFLKHGHVHVSPAWQTTGGLKGSRIILPTGSHTSCLRQVAQVKQKLRKGEFDTHKAVAVVQELFEAEVKRISDVISSYAAAQVATQQTAAQQQQQQLAETTAAGGAVASPPEAIAAVAVVAAEALPTATSLGTASTVATASAAAPLGTEIKFTPDGVFRYASELEIFSAWLATLGTDYCNKEAISFYTTFFQTQLCMDFLFGAISKLFEDTSSRDHLQADAQDTPVVQ